MVTPGAPHQVRTRGTRGSGVAERGLGEVDVQHHLPPRPRHLGRCVLAVGAGSAGGQVEGGLAAPCHLAERVRAADVEGVGAAELRQERGAI